MYVQVCVCVCMKVHVPVCVYVCLVPVLCCMCTYCVCMHGQIAGLAHGIHSNETLCIWKHCPLTDVLLGLLETWKWSLCRREELMHIVYR